jgi:hypothetical protein
MTYDIVSINVMDARSDDKSRLDESVLALRRELLDIPDVASVQPSRGILEERAKSGSAQIVGSLLVTISSTTSLTVLLRFLREWLKRNEGKKVTLNRKGEVIEIAGLSEGSIKELLSRWDISVGQHEP